MTTSPLATTLATTLRAAARYYAFDYSLRAGDFDRLAHAALDHLAGVQHDYDPMTEMKP